MPNFFVYRSIQRNFLDSLGQSKTEQLFIASLESLLASNGIDQLIGGCHSAHSTICHKDLTTNALFIRTFAELASHYSLANFTQAAAMACTLFNHYAYHPDTMFSSISFVQNEVIKAEDVQAMLTNEQWLALQQYFSLPESGPIDFSNLSVAVPRQALAEHTGLHPKQVPLALDAALSISYSVYTSRLVATTSKARNVTSNLLMVMALFAMAGWLRAIDYADLAQRILGTLYQYISTEPTLILDACLTSLRYQWRQQDFVRLTDIYKSLEDNSSSLDTEVCLTHLIDLQDLATLTRETDSRLSIELASLSSYQAALDDELTCMFADNYQGCIIIRGPEFLARQWLQAVGNQYHPYRRCYAIPTDTKTHATFYNKDGKPQNFEDLENLLDFFQPSKR